MKKFSKSNSRLDLDEFGHQQEEPGDELNVLLYNEKESSESESKITEITKTTTVNRIFFTTTGPA